MDPRQEQHHYDAVAEELHKHVLRPGLWTRAVAETGEEGAAARALYIRLRVAELISDEKAEAVRLQSAALAEEARRTSEARERQRAIEAAQDDERRQHYERATSKWYLGPKGVGLALLAITVVILLLAFLR